MSSAEKKAIRPTSSHYEGRPGPSKNGKGKGKGRADGLTKVTSSASSVSKIDLVHLEDVREDAQLKLNKKQKFRKHCARFWCCYVLGAVILLAIGLPILFLVIVPALAQRLVDDVDLPINGGSIIAVSDDAVKIGLETSLSVPGGLTVKLDPFELWLYNKNTTEFQPWSMVPMEQWTVSGKTDISIKDQVVRVGNRSELNIWLSDMLYNKQSHISARGNTTAHLGALGFDVKLDKTVTVDGLWSLEGYNLRDSRLLLPPRHDGVNIVGNMTLPNWSILDIGLGNLTFNAWAGDFLLGNVAVFDVFLEPGNTTLPFEGQLYLDTVFGNLVDILGSQAAALTSGSLEIGISGNSTLVDGEHITYLESVLNEAHFYSRVPITQLLTDFLAGVGDGSVKLEGLFDVLGDGFGPLLDDLLGGGGGGNGNSTDGPSSIPFDDIFGDLLDKLDENRGGNENSSSDSPLAELLNGLGMKSEVAKTRVRRFMGTARD